MGKMWMTARDSSFLKMDAAGFIRMLLPIYETAASLAEAHNIDKSSVCS
jgi:hypothetical protein